MKILIIDGSADTLPLLAGELSSCGYSVEGTEDLKTALSHTENGERPDLLMINLALCRPQFIPDLYELRKQNPQAAMVAISDFPSEAASMQAAAFGFKGFVTKPLNIDAVLVEFERIAMRPKYSYMPMGTPLRREPRFQISMELILELEEREMKQSVLENSVSQDISCTGACVASSLKVSIGDVVNLMVPEFRSKFLAWVRGTYISSNGVRYLNLEVLDEEWKSLVSRIAGLPALQAIEAAPANSDMDTTRVRVLDDRYRLDQLIGQGGIGAVYRAFDLKKEKVVAVKLIVDLGDNDQDRSYSRLLFQRECEMLLQMEHPNIVSILDSGLSLMGEPYLVMEFIEGETLDEILRKEGPWPVARVFELLKQICSALNQMHEKNVVHRDLKPSNIIIRKDGERVIATLVDLGLAKRVRDSGDGLNINSLTKTGMIVGTLPYLSPEQCMGWPLDQRTDIYSLGILTYELLSGQLPFEASSVGNWLLAHVKTEPTPLRCANPNITEDVERVVMWTLAKEVGSRPATTLEFLEQFAIVVNGLDDSGPQQLTCPARITNSAPTLIFEAGGRE